ncbi:putative werner helicase interacting protein 1 [Toxoplasma gondii MAS]|uniref:Putative werner helicase interacting protein 1 n=1 Tax=Toxoplasma gondii MAS TaxID=943118 RepID=A0A086PWI9_TOXGO|nr:putative werner helicase interacting protein 1 [Toxoplasma gondii MAS]
MPDAHSTCWRMRFITNGQRTKTKLRTTQSLQQASLTLSSLLLSLLPLPPLLARVLLPALVPPRRPRPPLPPWLLRVLPWLVLERTASLLAAKASSSTLLLWRAQQRNRIFSMTRIGTATTI